jgi:uncharacterized protein (TIGR00251 family)
MRRAYEGFVAIAKPCDEDVARIAEQVATAGTLASVQSARAMPLADVSLLVVAGGVRLAIYAKPRAKVTAIRGVRDGALEIALAAPPVDGAANEELVRFLADVVGVTKRDVVLLAGASGRQKRVELRGVGVDDVRAALMRSFRP